MLVRYIYYNTLKQGIYFFILDVLVLSIIAYSNRKFFLAANKNISIQYCLLGLSCLVMICLVYAVKIGYSPDTVHFSQITNFLP
jgi:hypothetical protein